MSDVIDRLRAIYPEHHQVNPWCVRYEAATEIERLRAEIEKLRKDAAAAWALCASISAENEKLRAKLMAATGELCDRAAAAALKETGDE